MQITNTTSVEIQLLPVCKGDISSVTNATDSHNTVCAECGVSFAPKGRQRFCSGVCRQRAYRRSPAHRAQLDGKKQQRMNRRNAWVAQRVRDKAYGTFPQLSGPEPSFKFPLSSLTLQTFSKKKEE
jgi:hypothetical protein